ncbi:uncharacterized protein RMCC_4077 [Mycolicibacterium canariasense]|uniref:Uncharacterized protein n=1 Tax=Mycolicibacterium canariasense TaxID=228230 RepID=A0A100WFG4_MYCCR|nr:uncharacterized protein RMCC_4077 [Mycolicibacterium canariasense]
MDGHRLKNVETLRKFWAEALNRNLIRRHPLLGITLAQLSADLPAVCNCIGVRVEVRREAFLAQRCKVSVLGIITITVQIEICSNDRTDGSDRCCYAYPNLASTDGTRLCSICGGFTTKTLQLLLANWIQRFGTSVAYQVGGLTTNKIAPLVSACRVWPPTCFAIRRSNLVMARLMPRLT